MTWLIVILIAVLVIFGCVFVYHTAEHHELHKMRAAFENKERMLINYYNNEKDIISRDGVTILEPIPKKEIQGAIEAMMEVLKMVDKEETEINHEFVNWVKKKANDIFHGKE